MSLRTHEETEYDHLNDENNSEADSNSNTDDNEEEHHNKHIAKCQSDLPDYVSFKYINTLVSFITSLESKKAMGKLELYQHLAELSVEYVLNDQVVHFPPWLLPPSLVAEFSKEEQDFMAEEKVILRFDNISMEQGTNAIYYAMGLIALAIVYSFFGNPFDIFVGTKVFECKCPKKCIPYCAKAIIEYSTANKGSENIDKIFAEKFIGLEPQRFKTTVDDERKRLRDYLVMQSRRLGGESWRHMSFVFQKIGVL